MNWKPNQQQRQEYADAMRQISEFCKTNDIQASRKWDSYYFAIDGQKYRVSNHTVEASDAGAYNWTGEQVRETYHDGRENDVIYIHAGKTRIIEIYNDLRAGMQLNGRGERS